MRWNPLVILLTVFLAGCGQPSDSNTQSEVMVMEDKTDASCPAWAQNAGLYEVNIRQYTPAGTFRAFAGHLPRLEKMGVDILWLMPVFPVSVQRRKGTLGSYYAVANFTSVNPSFGTMEELKTLIDDIHQRGMKVILDWVPHHTGWDHPWLAEHPEWYTRDEAGNIIDPLNPETGEPFGWTDVAPLNYDSPELRQAMIDAMKFWLEEPGVDGFRCDVAKEVPDDFWTEAIPQLRTVKPDLFMLAEAEHPPHRNLEGAFCATYGWAFHHLMNKIAQGRDSLESIDRWLQEDRQRFGPGYHITFVTNHDENSWKGPAPERLGPATGAMTVFYFTFTGMPLIYSGQEAGLERSLKFFEKDVIEWGDFAREGFLKILLDLKHRNRALWNGAAGGEPVRIPTSDDEAVYAFYREKEGDMVVVILNLSNKPREVVLESDVVAGSYTNVFVNSTTTVAPQMMLKMNAWDYVVLSNR